MRKIVSLAGLVFALLIAAPSLTITPAHAIDCNGRYQIIKDHGELSTPFCEISYLVEVSRDYGYDHSFRAVRKSFFLKQKICDHIGHDIRIDDICRSFRSDHGSNKYD